jgi:prepilin-type N-terminal cleavage/methylation domain-containing protein
MRPPPVHARAFTLIELLVVIAIIAILVGLLFPAFKAVQNQARSTQAKNDLTQIVNAVNAFYTDYGKYPTSATSDSCFAWQISGLTFEPFNAALLNELRSCNTTADPLSCSANATINTRQIVYISPPIVKDPSNPKSGIGTGSYIGRYFDPWGAQYNVEIDSNYDNHVPNPYVALGGSGAGPNPVGQGVIGWSNGPDLQVGTNSNNIYTNSDDVISWQ